MLIYCSLRQKDIHNSSSFMLSVLFISNVIFNYYYRLCLVLCRLCVNACHYHLEVNVVLYVCHLIIVISINDKLVHIMVLRCIILTST
jgi:hypothetical protein